MDKQTNKQTNKQTDLQTSVNFLADFIVCRYIQIIIYKIKRFFKRFRNMEGKIDEIGRNNSNLLLDKYEF
jgi:hypothetical protein